MATAYWRQAVVVLVAALMMGLPAPVASEGDPTPEPTPTGTNGGGDEPGSNSTEPSPSSEPEPTPSSPGNQTASGESNATQPGPNATVDPQPDAANSTAKPPPTTAPATPENGTQAPGPTPNGTRQPQGPLAGLPDLAVHAFPPQSREAADVPIVGEVRNLGGGGANATVLVTVSAGERSHTREVDVPALAHNESFPVPLGNARYRGLMRVELELRPSAADGDADPSNNAAKTWVEVRHPQSVQREGFLRFTTASGEAAATEFRVEETGQNVTILVNGTGETLYGFLSQEWLESRVGPVASDRNTREVRDGDEAYLRFGVEGVGWQAVSFGRFAPKERQPIFGRGSTESLLFDERPMRATIAQVPGWVREERTHETANGTQTVIEERFEEALVLDLDDGNPMGQSFWVSEAWLRAFGLQNATFAYQDGEIIPAEKLGSFYRVKAPHFSWVYIYEYCSNGQLGNAGLHGTTDCAGDGSTFYKMDYTDDAAQHEFRILTDHFTYKTAAYLDVWARASGPCTSGDSMTVFTGPVGSQVARFTFNPCDYFSQTAASWHSFPLQLSWIVSGSTYVSVRKTAPGWSDRNILFYYTGPHSYGQSVMTECVPACSAKTGELVWLLKLEVNMPPTAPNHQSPPANGATSGVATQVLLTWTAATDPDGDWVKYKVYFGTDSAFPGGPYWQDYGITSLNVWGTAGTTYFWKICATDQNAGHSDVCNTSGTNGVWSFVMNNLAPTWGSAQYLSPADGATNTPTSVGLVWEPAADADGDTVYYNVYVGASSPPTYVGQTTDTSYTFNGAPATTYGWRVSATDGLPGHGETFLQSGIARQFTTTSAVSPYRPVPLSPANGTTGLPFSATFSWTGGDPQGRPVRYIVSYHPIGQGTWYTACDVVVATQCTGTLAKALPSTQHTWYIKAYANSDALYTNSNWDDPWSFTTKPNDAPLAPRDPQPQPDAVGVEWKTLTPTFYADAAEPGDAHSHRVFRRVGPGGTWTEACPVETRQSAGVVSCGVQWGLGRSVTYEWKVVTTDRFGGSITGGPWTFTTKPNIPPAVCLSLASVYLTMTASSPCTDPDGDAVTYTIAWGDGATTTIGPTAAAPSIPSHDYPFSGFCPSGTPSVTITANDGFGGISSQTQGRTITDTRDGDVDGLVFCREALQGTSDADPDFDDDGLSDLVESNWWVAPEFPTINRNTVFCPTEEPVGRAGDCAPNPHHKDLYVEMDYMGDAGVDDIRRHLPPADVLDAVVAYFAAAPIANPDPFKGIKLHLDVKTRTSEARFDLGGANNVTHVNVLGTTECSNHAEWTDFWTKFDNIKTPNIRAGRQDYFHYALWAHQICNGKYGGVARGVPHRDFVVALGQPDPNINVDHGDNITRHGTFIHEFGHDLGLDHSGGTRDPNFEPNYFSIMNYRPTLNVDRSKYLGYSTRYLDTLNEGNLNESRGLNPYNSADPSLRTYLQGFRIDWDCSQVDDKEKNVTHPPAPSWYLDWNCDAAGQAGLRANINGHTGDADHDPVSPRYADGDLSREDCSPTTSSSRLRCEWLTGHHDWPAIRFDGLKKNPPVGGYGFDQRFEAHGGGVLGPLLPACGLTWGNEWAAGSKAFYVVVDRCTGHTGLWKECNNKYSWQESDCKLVGTFQLLGCQAPIGPLGGFYLVLDSCAVNIQVWQECSGPGWNPDEDCLVVPPGEVDLGLLECDPEEPTTVVILALQRYLEREYGVSVGLCAEPEPPPE